MNRFEGKVAVVTGGASGIGEAIVKRLCDEGASVVVSDINVEAGEALCNSYTERAVFFKADVADYAQVDALMQVASDQFGGLDILFNNAGIGCFAKTPDLDVEEWRRVIAIDLDSVFYGCKAAIPHFRKRGGGAIINTASASGIGGDYGFTAYNAAKGGVINYTRAVAVDHARENIRANAICPGPVLTPINASVLEVKEIADVWNATVPMGRWASPEEIAGAAVFLASDDASYITGSAMVVDGGLGAHTGQPDLFPYAGITE